GARRVNEATGWVGYLRISDRRQELVSNGMDAQREAIETWAAAAGVGVTAWASDIAPGTLEALEQREGLALAIGLVKSGQARGVVIARLDRLARDLQTQEFLLLEIGRWGEVASCLEEEARVLD